MNVELKSKLRTLYRQRRREMTLPQRKMATNSIIKRLIGLSVFDNAKQVALYSAYGSEINLSELIQLKPDIHYYYPRVTPQQTLEFIIYNKNTLMRKNKYGILEPQFTHENDKIATNELEIVLVPLIAFDAQGNRLGMGGGYYDRTFAVRTAKPLLIGVAFECQKCLALSHDIWDIPLDGVVTETSIYGTLRDIQ